MTLVTDNPQDTGIVTDTAAGGPDATATTRVIASLPALERELTRGLYAGWRALMTADPRASVFQSPGWCVPWYRAYRDQFEPYVVTVSRGGQLAGVVPLATERRTGHLSFASGTMADYRDIVALPDSRRLVAGELVRVYLAEHFPNPLQVGWMDPASDTPRLLDDVCRAAGVPVRVWQQPCHRWSPKPGENLNRKFSRVRTHLNALKRQGEASFDVITTPDDWDRFRNDFFRHHSLRQLQADREVSFDDARKQRFYDTVVASPEVETHVTALRLNGELVSGHVGLVQNGQLMLGAPSISLEHEGRSPSLLLLGWIIQHAGELGLAGLDLTIGDTEFKRRLGNQCVPVTMVEIHGRRSTYYTQVARREATAIAKGVVAAALGPDAWKTTVLPALASIPRRLAPMKLRRIAPPSPPIDLTTDDLTQLEARVDRTVGFNVGRNRVGDLLLAEGPEADGIVRQCARGYSRQRSNGSTLYSLVVGDRLAGLAFARKTGSDRGVISELYVAPAFASHGAREALRAAAARDLVDAGCTGVTVVQE